MFSAASSLSINPARSAAYPSRHLLRDPEKL